MLSLAWPWMLLALPLLAAATAPAQAGFLDLVDDGVVGGGVQGVDNFHRWWPYGKVGG